MSSPSNAALLTTTIFNPALLGKEDLVRGFVVRQELLSRLVDDLRRAQPGSPPQHQILIGQRGLGKTTMLRRVAFAIDDDPELSAKWLPLVFPEEQYNVKNLGDFWLNCADALSDALDRTGHDRASEELDARLAKVSTDPNQRSVDALALLLNESERIGRGLVLLVDNLDIVLERLDERQEWEFRRVISQDHRLYFLCASSKALEALYDHGRAFYDYFQVHDLKGLSEAEMFALMQRLAEEAGDEKVQRLLKEKPARLRALRVLTGGNPRTLVLLYRILSQGPEGDAQRDIEQLLDLYTPLYKSRFEELSPQMQQVVDAMAIHWDPITAGDLAQKLAPLSVNQVSSLLKRLEDYGLIEKALWFGEKKTAFQIAERFFNIWYLMRASRRVRRRLVWLVKFLQTWFEQDELKERAQTYLRSDRDLVGRERFAEMALAYAQVVDDRYLRRSLETAALQAALDVSFGGRFDFSDLPTELLQRKEMMERLAGFRSRVLDSRIEGIDSNELWRLIGGSPTLPFEMKAKIVADLPSMPLEQVQKIRSSLQRQEDILKEMYADRAAELRWLYGALASGEITDALDVEGALTAANTTGYRVLPIIAIHAQLWRIGYMPNFELQRLEDVLHRLGSEASYQSETSILWYRLAVFYEDLDRHEDAVRAHQNAVDLDPQNVNAWAKLGRLLDKLNRHGEAEGALLRAIKLNPKAGLLSAGLGILLLFGLDRKAEAERTFRHALDLDSRNAAAWVGLGVCAVNSGQVEEAEQAFRRATEVDPQNAGAWASLATLFEMVGGRSVEALLAFAKSVELKNSEDEWRESALRLARTVGSGPDLPTALESVNRLNECAPGNYETEFVLAGLLTLNRHWDRANEILRRLLSSETGEPDVWTFGTLVAQGHVADGIDMLETSGAHERWRPLYEALLAIRAGTPDYLRRVAPEVRIVAEEILNQIAPELSGRRIKS